MSKPSPRAISAEPLADQDARERSAGDLDVTMLVEAAAGTGKTTCMVRRMVALIRKGKCTIDKMAAVTFTRKAAAELKARFRIELEQAAKGEKGPERERLRQAVHDVDRAFIGTIH